jgi:predicted anti-sigma-YlaC factor YlaD
MRCRKVRRKLSAFLDGEVREKEKEKIASHLKACSSCGEKARILSSVLTLLEKGRESIKPSPYFWNRLDHRIAQIERKKDAFAKLLERINRAFIPATATAVLVIGLFIGIQLGEVVYCGIAESLSRKDSSSLQEAVDQSLYLSTLDDFPGESIGGVYNSLVTETKSPQER